MQPKRIGGKVYLECISCGFRKPATGFSLIVGGEIPEEERTKTGIIKSRERRKSEEREIDKEEFYSLVLESMSESYE